MFIFSDECDDVLADGAWQRVFKERPEPLTVQERKDWVARQSGVTVGSDAFFPFGDNVERARKSGVTYIAEPGGSIRDDNVIETANKYGITMALPDRDCSITKRRNETNETHGHRRRRPRTRHCQEVKRNTRS